MSKNVLSVENVTMQFGGVVAVDNLSLEVNEGEIVALIGPNGAGKTTAFNVITGVYAPTNGRVRFNEACIVRNHPTGKMKKMYKGEHADMYTVQFAPEEELDEAALKAWKEGQKALDAYAFTDHVLAPTPDKITALGMARTFQNIRLFSDMTVLENVMIGRHCRTKAGIWGALTRNPATRREEQESIDISYSLLETVHLQDLWNEKACNLAYGAQRRLEIARALATEPRMLLLDEPAAGMNPQETNELKDLVLQIRADRDLSILLIEHDMGMVMSLSDRIYVMEYGSRIAAGTPAEVRSNPRVIQAYLGESEDA